MSYKEMAQAYLKQKKPEELKRMQESGEESMFLRSLEKMHEEQEQFLVQQMTESLPDDPIERAKALNMARMIAREVTASDLSEFLSKA